MVPAQGLGVVAEAEFHLAHVEFFHAEAEDVLAAEGAQVEAVVLAGDPAELGVEVVKEHLGVVGKVVAEQGEEEVEVGPAGRGHE